MQCLYHFSSIAHTYICSSDGRIALTRHKTDFSWMVTTPGAASELLATDHELLASATALLANSVLVELPDPIALDKVCGTSTVVSPLVEAWAALLRAQGKNVDVVDGHFDTRVSYATKASLPPLPSTLSTHIVAPATPVDLDAAAVLYQDFQATAPWRANIPIEQAREILAAPLKAGLVWLCRLEPDGLATAFVILGRATPRTIAVRNVYVLPAHRRKGIAETMVRAITRYYLGVPPYGVRGVPTGRLSVG